MYPLLEPYNLPPAEPVFGLPQAQDLVSSRLTNFAENARVQKGYLQSGNFVSGEIGWQIKSNGDAEFQNVNIGVKNISINSTQSVQTAINTLNTAGGGILHLKAGTYVITSPIVLYSNIRIEGESYSTVTLYFSAGANNITMTGTNVYTTGTISSIAGGVNVTGSGTTWTSAMVGRQLFISNRWYVISAFVSTTAITLASGYADGPTYSGTYRIASPITDVELIDLTLTGSTTTAIVGTDVRDILWQDVIIPANNKGFALTSFMNITPIRVAAVSNTSNGYELTNGSFFNATQVAAISNGGHGALLNGLSSCPFNFSAANANTTDGFNCTDVDKCLFAVEASGNGGQGIEFVSGCDNNFINNALITSNVSDGIKLTATSDSNTIGSSLNLLSNGGYGINIAASTCDTNAVISPIFSGNTSGPYLDNGTGTIFILSNSVSTGNQDIFGDGSDGTVTISGNTTLTTDMFYDTLTVNSSIILNTGGFIVFVKNTLTNNGTIQRTPNAGASGSTATDQNGAAGGGAGAALASGTLFGSNQGQSGNTGGTGELAVGQNGGAGVGATGASRALVTTATAASSAGGNGGAGSVSAGGTGGAGATGGTPTPAVRLKPRVAPMLIFATEAGSASFLQGGAGSASGGAGAGGGGNGVNRGGGGGGSGGSGSSGGIVVVAARNIVNAGTISAPGGASGAGGNGAAGQGANAGGGGGGTGGVGTAGGVLGIIYSSLTNSGTINAPAGAVGAAGTGGASGGGAGNAGSNGSAGAAGPAGIVITLQV